MNWVDLAVLGVILVSGFLAFARGLVREALGLGAWALAGFAAFQIEPTVEPFVMQYFTDATLAKTLSFIGVFALVLIVLSLLASAIAAAVRGSVLGGLDRTLGLLFGLLRGAALVCAAYIVLGFAEKPEQWPAPVQDARLLPLIYQGAAWGAEQIPAGFRPHVEAPVGRATTSAELLRANPVGRALGARPAHD